MKYWLSTLPEDMPLQCMVLKAKVRWRIERGGCVRARRACR